MKDLRAAKQAAKQALRDVDGIEGFGIGADAVRVYVRDAEAARNVPAEIEGVAVECVVTGKIEAGGD